MTTNSILLAIARRSSFSSRLLSRSKASSNTGRRYVNQETFINNANADRHRLLRSGRAAVCTTVGDGGNFGKQSWVYPLSAAMLALSFMATSTNTTQNEAAPSTKNITSTNSEGDEEEEEEEEEDETTTLLNWSGTHSVNLPTKNYHEPETIPELEQIIKTSFKHHTPIRPIGSALSPNGLAFESGGMISLAHLDKIIEVDKHSMTVTVQAGAKISQVIAALRPHGLTLPNLASIAEQQMGGFVQVSAHGSGALIPPVDEFVTQFKMVTPYCGTVLLRPKRSDGKGGEEDDPYFHVARVGLGCLGILSEITMKVIPAHRLVEHTFVLKREEAVERLDQLLVKHKHVRYMWIPYEDAVVVVTNDVEDNFDFEKCPEAKHKIDGSTKKRRFQPMMDLLVNLTKDTDAPYTEEQVLEMGFGEIRDALMLAGDPLDVPHVKKCNEAEAEFWRRSEGYQIRPSDELLQFDCGGQQWVWEVCFPTGTLFDNNHNDTTFMTELLKSIEDHNIPAHSPIEQRWTASSSSFMSPANGPPDGLHSWVGVIMYLPSDEPTQRQNITSAFRGKYCNLVKEIGKKVNATSHWAKLELPDNEKDRQELKETMKKRFPVQLFNFCRYTFDPTNILSNDMLNELFGDAKPNPLKNRAKRSDGKQEKCDHQEQMYNWHKHSNQ